MRTPDQTTESFHLRVSQPTIVSSILREGKKQHSALACAGGTLWFSPPTPVTLHLYLSTMTTRSITVMQLASTVFAGLPGEETTALAEIRIRFSILVALRKILLSHYRVIWDKELLSAFQPPESDQIAPALAWVLSISSMMTKLSTHKNFGHAVSWLALHCIGAQPGERVFRVLHEKHETASGISFFSSGPSRSTAEIAQFLAVCDEAYKLTNVFSADLRGTEVISTFRTSLDHFLRILGEVPPNSSMPSATDAETGTLASNAATDARTVSAPPAPAPAPAPVDTPTPTGIGTMYTRNNRY